MEAKMIGHRIADARKKMNISQAQLAEHLFISPQAVGKWERGESLPDIIMLNRLAEMLGVDLNYFSGNFRSETAEATSATPLERQSAETSSAIQKEKPGWDMSRGNWANADFSGLKNLHEKFSSSNMQQCLFIGSDLSGLLLKSNNINSCDFSDSNFGSSHVQRSNLTGNQFIGCSLNETEFSGSYVYDCDFTGADFSGVTVKTGGFQKNKIAGAVWNRTSFIDTQLAEMVFEGALKDCSFENCAFAKVEFQNATLINTFFKNNRKMKKVRFTNCKADKITYAFLKSNLADLTGVTILAE